jgi:hypothetical protein
MERVLVDGHAQEGLTNPLVHIAPPNWYTYCGLTPDPDTGVVAYDTCSLPAEGNFEGWCPECVRLLHEGGCVRPVERDS